MNAEPITFGSLFAGIGGFDLGFERAGMSCKWQVEIDDYANRVLEKHWPEVHRERDIKQCGRHNLEQVDVICGGFPCQDISYAGRGAGLDGERSGLFFEAVRVVRELQPRIVVLENVAALLTRGLDRVLGTLAEIGFDAEWHCIPAASVGAPHIRDRVFVIAINTDAQCGEYNPESRTHGSVKKNREANATSGWGRVSDDAGGIRGSMADTSSGRLQGCDGSSRSGESSGSYRLLQSSRGGGGISRWWATEPNVGRVANGVPARVDRLRGLGNAVVPQVAEFIGRLVLEKLNEC